MHKGLTVSAIVLSTALALSGCMTRQGDVGNKNIRPNNVRMQGANGPRFMNDQANEQNRIGGTQQMNNNIGSRLHGNTRMEMSQKIADQLAALPEVHTAYVMLTDRNAYVAITEDRDGLKMQNRNREGANMRAKDFTSGAGTTGGGTGLTGTNGAGMPGTGGTSSTGVSDFVKNKVADIVKGMAPTVDNVYVSANPDFYGRMKGYADQVNSGRPIQGLITEFNALVDRIFPTASGTNSQVGTYPKTAPSPYAPATPFRQSMSR